MSALFGGGRKDEGDQQKGDSFYPDVYQQRKFIEIAPSSPRSLPKLFLISIYPNNYDFISTL